jgi:arylsulfatase A-like enzyme
MPEPTPDAVDGLSTAAERPNVLWIVMEDVSARFGCSGDDLARTPAIDDLATTGRRYPNAFSTAGVCAPSRASLMTGMYPPTIGAHHMRTQTHDVEGLPASYDAVPPHYVTAFSEYLRRAGYYCTLDSKTDYQFGEPTTMWDHHCEGAGWWDDRRETGQPFFAMVTNGITHESGMWAPAEGGDIDDPETDPSRVDVPPYLVDTEPTRRAIARQYDNLARSDQWIGDLLERLEADGHAEDTIVVLTADHGEGLPRKKRWPYDSGTNVPLIVRWPGQTEGRVCEDLVSLVDLPATTLSLAGCDVPRWMHGRPFLGPERESRDYAVSTRDRYDESYDTIRSIRGERFRYVRHYYVDRPYVQHVPYRNRHPAMKELLRRHAADDLDAVQNQWFADTRPTEELYDLRADPHEVENLAEDPAFADVLERLRGALDDWRQRTGDRGLAEESEAQLRERGWPDGEQPRTTAPAFVPNAPGNRGQEFVSGEVTLETPATLSLYCGTQGASIAYTTATGNDPHWQLYDGPLSLPEEGTLSLRAKAVRYGYAESEESRLIVQCE